MPPRPTANSPSHKPCVKRESLTVSRSVGKALADVMNRVDQPGITSDSDTVGAFLAVQVSRRAAATTRERTRGSRPSLDLVEYTSGGDKVSPKLIKRPSTSHSAFPSKPVTRRDNASSMSSGSPPGKNNERISKPQRSLTLRGLSSAFQTKSTQIPSALPKYKPKPEVSALSRSGTKKRLSDWDGDKDPTKDESTSEAKISDEDDFVTVERPISPLPRRAAQKSLHSLLPSSSPPKHGNVLHKSSGSVSSSPSRGSKVPKASPAHITPKPRMKSGKSSVHPPSSSTFTRSQSATPVKNSAQKSLPISRPEAMSSTRLKQRSAPTDGSVSSGSRLDASPGDPFQISQASGASLLSPPLSPSLEGVSLDSIDVADVSALLSTIVSPVKAASVPPPISAKPLSEISSGAKPMVSKGATSSPPQTPISESFRPDSLPTDPRQSLLSIRQVLENTGDLEHLLSQPLPSILTPDARERLLSFGFSPDLPPPPFPPNPLRRPEPQTPSPGSGRESFTSISQVLFPSSAETGGDVQKLQSQSEGGAELVELLRKQLALAEAQRAERDVRIGRLEGEIVAAREAREKEATELSKQVSRLEEQLKQLLDDHEREDPSKWKEDVEERLRDKDAEWEREFAALTTKMEERNLTEQERLLETERHKSSMRNAVTAWECVKTTALSELELVRAHKVFVQVTLAGLDLVK